jgi:hypothetical protein
MRQDEGNKKAGNAFGIAEAVPEPNLRYKYLISGAEIQAVFVIF